MTNMNFIFLALPFIFGFQEKSSPLQIFKKYITGDFDNKRQIEEEIKQGKQIHPYAVHINRLADKKIKNKPKRKGFWLIEESYYTYPDGKSKINHHLFFFEALGTASVTLYAYDLPKSLPMAKLVNTNMDLVIDFNDLKISSLFKPASYQFDGKKTFTINAPNEWPDNMKFTLIEKFTPGVLEVMELVEKNGVSITPYETPIIYVKK
ncbi:MAG: hypothetical protein EBS35_07405 [Bacteroidetes bacterium]|nr:hypothetical protein [Bacteroidota bacterium]